MTIMLLTSHAACTNRYLGFVRMDFILKLLNTPTRYQIIGATLAIAWNIYKYLDSKRTEINHKEFELFQKLIQNLVKPKDEKGTMYIDQQTAMLYELSINIK